MMHNYKDSESGILPITWKFYIAIMAVSCYDCEYLMFLLTEQFILHGGDIEWITLGLKSVDPKLQRIATLNEVLAH
jgi:sestrin